MEARTFRNLKQRYLIYPTLGCFKFLNIVNILRYISFVIYDLNSRVYFL